ncbi:hypothetical protein BJY01DRAFT_246671 [Aspergillus pseudoustus]|uniref:Transglycosylase SLT domain-containing protein n=1 Tax=Aspergillus pseudoustus TaxID=1810923 RepID=A0ABR4K632_9EURO
MASEASTKSQPPVLPAERDDTAYHSAWTDWAKRAPGQKLTADKERYTKICADVIDQFVRDGLIARENSRKAFEVLLLTAHRESDFNPHAKNPRSTATGMLQQITTFHQRSRLNSASARNVLLTVEQRTDVATASTLFLRQLVCTKDWDKLKICDAAYEVQKFHPADMHRFDDPTITREVTCLAGAMYPKQASMTHNEAYSPLERAPRRT